MNNSAFFLQIFSSGSGGPTNDSFLNRTIYGPTNPKVCAIHPLLRGFMRNFRKIETTDRKTDFNLWETHRGATHSRCKIMITSPSSISVQEYLKSGLFWLLLKQYGFRQKFLKCCRYPYFESGICDSRLSFALNLKFIECFVCDVRCK